MQLVARPTGDLPSFSSATPIMLPPMIEPRDLARVPSARRDQVRDARAEAHFEIARRRDRAARYRRDAARDGLAALEIAKERGGGPDVLAEVTDVRRLRERRHLLSRHRLDELALAAGGIHRRHGHDGEPLLRVERRQRALQRFERFRFVFLDRDDAVGSRPASSTSTSAPANTSRGDVRISMSSQLM